MSCIIYNSPSRFNKFFIKDLFTNELIPCSEKEFNDIILRFRYLFTIQYDGVNAQNFVYNGIIEARRER